MTWEHGRVGNGNLAAPGVGRGQMPGRFGAEPHLPGQRANTNNRRAGLSPFVVPLLPWELLCLQDWGGLFFSP